MQNIIKNQQMVIVELELLKNKAIEELADFKIQFGYKTDQLNEYKQKIEVKFTLSILQNLTVYFNFKIMPLKGATREVLHDIKTLKIM